jgi:hypothetical protein
MLASHAAIGDNRSVPSLCPCRRHGLVATVSRVSIAGAAAGALTVLGSSHKAAGHGSDVLLGWWVRMKGMLCANP